MAFSKWLSILSALAVVFLLILSASAQQSPPADEITKLAEDVYLFRHHSHQAIFIVTQDGVIVTDPISPDAAAWLKLKIATITDQPVRYVIYSRHHNDHISGGSALPGRRAS